MTGTSSHGGSFRRSSSPPSRTDPWSQVWALIKLYGSPESDEIRIPGRALMEAVPNERDADEAVSLLTTAGIIDAVRRDGQVLVVKLGARARA